MSPAEGLATLNEKGDVALRRTWNDPVVDSLITLTERNMSVLDECGVLKPDKKIGSEKLAKSLFQLRKPAV